MEDTTRLKIILVGIFLAAVALGYFIFVQRRNEQEFKAESRPIQQIETSQATLTVTPTPSGTTLGQTTKGGQPSAKVIDELPATGIPTSLAAVFAVSAAIIGWSLKKFPK